MSGLTQTEVDKLIQAYYDQRQALSGPRLTIKETLVDIRALSGSTGPAEGETMADYVKRFIDERNKEREAKINPLKPQ